MQLRTFWSGWARFLHHWGLSDLAANLLEGLGPLRVLAAQALYLGQPLLDSNRQGGHFQALAALLEDPNESCLFAAYLREGGDRTL